MHAADTPYGKIRYTRITQVTGNADTLRAGLQFGPQVLKVDHQLVVFYNELNAGTNAMFVGLPLDEHGSVRGVRAYNMTLLNSRPITVSSPVVSNLRCGHYVSALQVHELMSHIFEGQPSRPKAENPYDDARFVAVLAIDTLAAGKVLQRDVQLRSTIPFLLARTMPECDAAAKLQELEVYGDSPEGIQFALLDALTLPFAH